MTTGFTFYVKTKEIFQAAENKNWMLLFIDSDQDKQLVGKV